MGDGISIKWDAHHLLNLLDSGQRESVNGLSQALSGEAQLMLREATRLAPWRTRVLIGSATVLPPIIMGTMVTVRFGFGGAASKYAMIQHEKYPVKRKPGRQWHYLSDPVKKMADQLGQKVTVSVGHALGA